MQFDPEVAYPGFKLRYLEAQQKPHINDSDLPVGSPMHFYCHGCGVLIGTLPENYINPLSRYCDPCEPLNLHGLLEIFRRRADQEATDARANIPHDRGAGTDPAL